MASPSPRSSCSFLTLLLSLFNFIIFILSASSIAPMISLRIPPTPLGWAFLLISFVSLLSAFIGFYSRLTHLCYITHVSLLLAASTGQLIGVLVLFSKEKWSLSMLKSARDRREAKVFVRLECGFLMAMLVMQLVVLLLSCVVHSCWVREYEGRETDREAVERKRRQKLARIQEESAANTARIAEVKNREFDEKIIKKYGKWMNNYSQS